MSMPSPTFSQPEHDPVEATRWFNQWHVYRSIVDNDWMCHQGIFSAIKTWVLLRYPGPFTLLDLGCGDAGFIQSTFTNSGLWLYTGVDASQAALTKARTELSSVRLRVELLEADLLAYLAGQPREDKTLFDVILASYAVHHLPSREKQDFFRQALAQLAPGGSLLFADVFRRGDESREDYLKAYVGMMRDAWTGLDQEGLASTTEHVVQRDFPETLGAIEAMSREAGFQDMPQELYRDATGFHRLLGFTKGRRA
jgi:SAM-dependent methyltransferase